MRRVLSGRCDAVVTRATCTQNLHVINSERRCPQIRRVAVLTDISGRDMRRRLADGLYAIVAADTIAGNIDVIEIRRQPGHRGMAIIAVNAARYMSRVLAGRDSAIMT